MTKHIDAWIHDGKVMLGFPEGVFPFHGLTAAMRAREVLRENDFDFEPSFVEIYNHREVVYVDPEPYNEGEEWAFGEWSAIKERGRIEVWMIDIRALLKDRGLL